MRVDNSKLVVVVLIRMLVISKTIVPCRIIRIIHPCAEIWVIECFILVGKAERVADFLAHHHISPRRRVLRAQIEIEIIPFARSLGSVFAARPYLRDAEPAVVAIAAIANFNPAGCCLTGFWLCSASDNCGIEYGRDAPVS